MSFEIRSLRVYSSFVACFFLAAGTLWGDGREPLLLLAVRDASEVGAHLEVPGRVGLKYTLLKSSDLRNWDLSGSEAVGRGGTLSFPAGEQSPRAFFKIKVVVNDSITSNITAIEYPVHVYLPAGYEDSSKDYPILYATDGQWVSNGFAHAVKSRNKELILVTIEQGPGDRRAIDFLLPGAVDYFEFFRGEFMPAIESIYRVDTRERTICGTSYGGLLVGLVFLMDDVEAPLFRNYLSFDGSFRTHPSTTNALEQKRFEASGSKKGVLYLTSATRYPNNDFWVTSFENRIRARQYAGLQVIRKSYPVAHNDVAQPSFDEALDTLFD